MPLPAEWFRKDPQQLLQELGQLSKADLLQTLVAVLGQDSLTDKAHNIGEVVRGAQANTDSSTSSTSNWGPEYNTRQLAKICRISRQAIVLRVHKLVATGWLEERMEKLGKWSFDKSEAQIILRYPRNRGPLKKRPS